MGNVTREMCAAVADMHKLALDELITCQVEPDWPRLSAAYPGNVLLHVDCPLSDVASRVRGDLVYLATPYSRLVADGSGGWDRGLSLLLGTRAARWARALALEGVTAVSPIVMAVEICHADVEGLLDPLDDAFWSRWCQPLLSASAAVVVPPMVGWDQSAGVWREACWALRHNVPVYLIAEGAA